jgi:GNAT superfamily N-acetyltransferase
MSTPPWAVRHLTALDDAQIDGLSDVLIDCVEGGASVSFMHPLTRDRAGAFWRRVAQGVAAGERALLVAEDGRGLCGTVQLLFDLPENQPHRADLAKMLVHRRARCQGLGAALVRAAEATARDCGKTLLVLDAVTGGDAERLYERLGWKRVGVIPGYALFPRGGLCSTTVFYRDLGRQSGGRASPQKTRAFGPVED